jgi:putative peptidoglycan lipid II flippase
MASSITTEKYSTAGFNNTFITFFSKVVGYFSFILIAYIFGTQVSTDIFFLGSSFITVCTGLFTILTISIFPPILIRLRTTDSLQEALNFASTVFTWLLSVAVIIACLILIFPVEIFLNVSKYDAITLANNKRLLTYFGFIFLATVGVEYLRVFIQSMGLFTTTAIISFTQSIILVVCILTLSGYFQVESLAIGTLLSLIIQFVLLFTYCNKKNMRLHVSFKKNRHLKELLRVGLPLWMAHWVTLAAIYYSDYAATGLKGGTLTAVTFSQKIYILPIVIIFNPLLEIINTKFSESYYKSKKLLQEHYIAIIRVLLFILVPISMFMIIFRYEIVHVLFVRGAFTESDAAITATCLGIYSLIIISTCVLQTSVRVIFTLQKTGWTSLFGTIGFILTILAMHYFVRWYGYWGLPLGKVLIELCYFVPYTLIFIYFYLDKPPLGKIFYPLVKYLIISITIIITIRFALLQIFQYLFHNVILNNVYYLGLLCGCSILCIGLYYWINALQKNDELKFITDSIFSRFKNT